MKERKDQKSAFTLIELLIVVAIIAILAAIAVPNFLEAQTRSRVSRVKADMKSVVTALEAYAIDNRKYINPYTAEQSTGTYFSWLLNVWDPNMQLYRGCGYQLTSPIAYITSLPLDPFIPPQIYEGKLPWTKSSYLYTGLTCNSYETDDVYPVWHFQTLPGFTVPDWKYILRSPGPCKRWYVWPGACETEFYDPSNGTISQGNIWLASGRNFIPRN